MSARHVGITCVFSILLLLTASALALGDAGADRPGARSDATGALDSAVGHLDDGPGTTATNRPATGAVEHGDSPAHTRSEAVRPAQVVRSISMNQPPERTLGQDDVPELPETVVRGRPSPFPATPVENDVVLSAGSDPSRRAQVGSSVTVLNTEHIERSGKTSVSGLLRDVAGVDVVRQGGTGSITSVFLRGANSQHTKVLLDGIPMNDPSNATRGFDFSSLDVENIERIEVLRGPQSLLYGSDAIGGVIAIYTKRGDGPLSIHASGRGGTFGTSRESMQLSGGNDQLYYSLGGAYTNTAGISQASRRLGYTERDGYTNGTMSGRFGWNPFEWLNVDYVFRWTDAQTEIDDFDFFTALPSDNLIRKNLSRSFYSRVQLQSLTLDGALEQKVAFALATYDRDDTDPGLFTPPTFQGETARVSWSANLLLTQNNTLSAGLNHSHETARSTFNPEATQNLSGVFVMDQWQWNDVWFVTAGARWDDHSVAGSANTYRVTNRLDVPGTRSSIHGAIGTGFRAPALAENLFAFGNPNLLPEKSKGWDLGLRQDLIDGELWVDATYFRNDLSNLIVFDFNSFRLENVGQARSTGVEVQANWQVHDDTVLRANYTYTDTTNLDNSQVLLRRPRNKAGFGIQRWFCKHRGMVDANLLVVGDRLDTRNVTLNQYYLLNLTGTFELDSHWQLFVHGANLLDDRYEEVHGYGTSGLAVYAGLDFRN